MILAASTEAAAATEAVLSIGPVYRAWFIEQCAIFLALDLGVFHKPHAVGFGEALMWTSIWFSPSMAFAFWIAPAMVGEQWTGDHTKLFITGYVVELSLSMDNVFVIALIFSFFRVPAGSAPRSVLGHPRRADNACGDDSPGRQSDSSIPLDPLPIRCVLADHRHQDALRRRR